MCGIAGYFGKRTISNEILQATLAKMQNRGPDHQAFVAYRKNEINCYLLYSRLSIIDLSRRSQQPFYYKDKILVYNGEIYNYVEIRTQLEQAGHTFVTTSDTEVVIHAVDEWGLAALNKFDGMWAFAFFNTAKNELILARDPFGEKPLYLYQPTENDYYFGSEVKFLAALSNKVFTPKKEHLIRFLVNGYKSLYKSDDTFFNSVQKFPAASFQKITTTYRSSFQKYWQPKLATQIDMSFTEAVKGTRELLIDTVRTRLRSDIPIAFCMSGGIDSNSLISIAKKIFNYDVHGFTMVNVDKRYEEQEMINQSVTALQINHHHYPVSAANFIKNLQNIIANRYAPLLTISHYLDWQLHNAIKQHGFRVSINGAAGDELFSGYFDHHLMYLFDIREYPTLFEQSIANWKANIAPIVRNPYLQDPYTFIKKSFYAQTCLFKL